MHYHAFSDKGTDRDYNEDRYVIKKVGRGDSFIAFGIFDGHGGFEVADYVSKKMLGRLKFDYKKSEIWNVIKKIQVELTSRKTEEGISIGYNAGSTGLVVMLQESTIKIINLGDCRAVIYNSMSHTTKVMTTDHKPDDPDEKNRIIKISKQFGHKNPIVFRDGAMRVGALSVCRGFGDFDNAPYVSDEPEMVLYHLRKNDEFIIIGCDGLWDSLSNEEATKFIRMKMEGKEIVNNDEIFYYPQDECKKSKNLARHIVEYAMSRGSTDNVTAIVIFLKDEYKTQNFTESDGSDKEAY